MVILIGIFLLFVLVIIVEKRLYRFVQKEKLYKSFQTWSQVEKGEVNREYLKEFSIQDRDKRLYQDLELEQIFSLIHHTYTGVGKEYMYAQMFVANQDHEQLERIINHLQHKKLLKETIYVLHDLSHTYSSSLQFFSQQSFFSSFHLKLMAFLTSLLIVLLIGSCFNSQMLKYVLLWCAVLSMTYTYYSRLTNDMMSECMCYWYVVDCLNKLNHLHLFSNQESQNIQQMIKTAKRYTRISRVIHFISYIDIFYIMEFVKAMFFIPIYQCYILLKNKDVLFQDYLKMYEYVGMVDMAISLMRVRAHYQTCLPQISQEPLVSFKNAYHPLIENPVKNSFSTRDSCLITGSNASGKSTFLKMLGMNMVMAKAYHTCFADEFIYYPYQLYSSIHIRDNLLENESYYVQEIKTL